MRYNFDSIFSRLFLILTTVLIIFSFSEIFFYLKAKISVSEHSLQDYQSAQNHWPRPYVMAAFKPTFPLNPLGYIDAAPTSVKTKPRIVLLGGSTMATNSPTISEALQVELARRGLEVETFNLGVASSVSRQDMIRILIDSTSYRPDLIIHYGGGNDITYGADNRINYPHRYFLQEIDSALSQKSDHYNLFKYLILGSSTWRYLFPEYTFKIIAGDYLNQFKPKVSAEEISRLRAHSYVQNLKLSKMIANYYGSRFLAFFQPLLYYKNFRSPEEKNMDTPDANPFYQHWRDLVKSDVLAYGVEPYYFDLSHLFENTTTQIYRDRIHFLDNETNRLVAKQMADYVVAALKTSAPKDQMGALTTEVEFLQATGENEQADQ